MRNERLRSSSQAATQPKTKLKNKYKLIIAAIEYA